MKKVLIIISVIIVLGVAVYFFFVKSNAESYSFRYDTISKGNLTLYVTATGTLNAVTTVQVGTQVSGRISKLYADFNSIVKAGQVIAQIDPTFLKQAVLDSKANLDRAQAQFDDAERNFARAKILYKKNLESQVNYDAAMTTYESNKASLQQAGAQLERAKINLAYTTIYAPINGVVIDRKVSVGQTVAASFSSPTLFTIANDLSKMQVQATVDESDIGKVNVGQKAIFTVDAFPNQNFTGTVSQIRLAPVVQNNVVNYIVIIDVHNDKLLLMPGMTANVKILVAEKKNVLRVYNMALRFQPPPDLMDTAAVNNMMKNYRNRFNKNGLMKRELNNGKHKEKNRVSLNSNKNKNTSQMRNNAAKRKIIRQLNGRKFAFGISREKLRSIRDSLRTAHGGKLSRRELIKELREVLEKNRNKNNRLNRTAVKQVKNNQKPTNKYTIDQVFPQYEKNSYVPSEQLSRGRLWVLDSKGLLKPVIVETGLNDGRYTEIISSQLKEGEKIVLGATLNSNDNIQSGRNPFMGTRRRRGGRFR